MQQPEQDDAPTIGWSTGCQDYQEAIAEMLRRLALERLVERLWSRDPSLWYPAAETQARIVARLGWLDLPVDQAIGAEWLALLRARGIAHLLYVGSSDATIVARLWRDLTVQTPNTARFTVLESSDPSAVQAALLAYKRQPTALILAADAMLSPDLDALTRIVLTAHASAHRLPLAVIAPPAAPLLSLVQAYATPELVPLPPDLGARFGPLSSLAMLPAAWLGWSLDHLRDSALELRAQCRCADMSRNPGVWLGTTLAVLAQRGRDKLTLLASPELLPLARWIAAFIAGALSKHGRGFVIDVHTWREAASSEQRAASSQQPADRIVVVLRLAAGENDQLDQERAALAAAGLPLVTLELADRYAVAGQIVVWQIAAATIGVVLGLNPFDEPDTAARDEFLWRSVQSQAALFLPPGTPLAAQPFAAAWQQLRSTIVRTRCIVIAAYLPPLAPVDDLLAELRAVLARHVGATVVVVDPLRDHAFATQVLHAGRPCALLLLTADLASTLAVPGRDWTLADLRRQRIAADLLAWTQLKRGFVHLDLGSDVVHGLRRCLELLATLEL